MDKSTHDEALSNVFLFQGAYFVITGVWPVVGIDSFMIATGPKQDIWLVHMVGFLAISIGLTFLISSLRQQRLPIFLAYATALSFLAMDIIYVASGVIQRIYLLDAAIQFLFLTLLSIFIIRKKRRNRK